MESKLGCAGLIVGLIILICLVVIVQAFIIQLGWNYVVVDGLKLAATKMTFKMAVIVAFVISVVTGGSRASASKS